MVCWCEIIKIEETIQGGSPFIFLPCTEELKSFLVLCPQYRSDTQIQPLSVITKIQPLLQTDNSQSSSLWWNSKKPSKGGSAVTNIEGPVSRRLLLGGPLGYNPAGSDGFLNMARKVSLR